MKKTCANCLYSKLRNDVEPGKICKNWTPKDNTVNSAEINMKIFTLLLSNYEQVKNLEKISVIKRLDPLTITTDHRFRIQVIPKYDFAEINLREWIKSNYVILEKEEELIESPPL